MFTLNDQPLQSATLTVPRHGVWTGIVAVAGELALALGAAVTLVLGDTTFRGYVVAGGTFAGASESTYTIAGGAGGWAKTVPEKGYQLAQGVRLSAVAAHLAAAAGEQLELAGDRVLGAAWTRPAGPASVALSALFPLELGGWRVDPDGVARPGVRPPAPVPSSVQLAVAEYSAARRWARVGLPDDTVSALLPGAIVSAPNLTTPVVVGETTIRASMDAVVVEVLGEAGVVEMFAALILALTPSRIFNGRWTYQVVNDGGGKPNLRALASTAGLPPELAVETIPGVAGASATLAPGALVLLEFREGDPARPYISSFLGGVLPLTVGLNAQTRINLGDAIAPAVRYGDQVTVGTTTGPITFVAPPTSSSAPVPGQSKVMV